MGSARWPLVPLDAVLALDLDRVPVDPTTTYEMAGVYSFGRGLFRREPVFGGATSYRYFYRLKPEHVVMSQLFGWEGALALSTEEFAGVYVSPQFPTFLCDSARLDRQFLGWIMRRQSFWADLAGRTKGMGDRRRTVDPGTLLRTSIPLPPLNEQRRAIARLNSVAARGEEIERLQTQVASDAPNVLALLAHRPDLARAHKLALGWENVALGDVLNEHRNAVRVEAGRQYPNLGIYSFGRGLFHKPPISGVKTSASTLYSTLAGQFIYSRLFAFEGAYAVVPDEFDGFYVSNEYPTFDLDGGRVKPEFLYAYFQSPRVWSSVAIGSKGLGHRRQRVHPEQLLGHRLLLPPMEWQQTVSVAVRRVEGTTTLAREASVVAEALLPSVLEHSFGFG